MSGVRPGRAAGAIRACAAIAATLALPLICGCATTRMSLLGPYALRESEHAPAELEEGRWYALVAWTDSGNVRHSHAGRVSRVSPDSLEFAIQRAQVHGRAVEDFRRLAADSVRSVRARHLDRARTAAYGTAYRVVAIAGAVVLAGMLALLAIQSLLGGS